MSVPASLKGLKLEPMYVIWPQIVELISFFTCHQWNMKINVVIEVKLLKN